jgi:hypothetical protein
VPSLVLPGSPVVVPVLVLVAVAGALVLASAPVLASVLAPLVVGSPVPLSLPVLPLPVDYRCPCWRSGGGAGGIRGAAVIAAGGQGEDEREQGQAAHAPGM